MNNLLTAEQISTWVAQYARAERKARKWSAQRLSNEISERGLDVSREMIANQENGRTLVPLAQAVVMSRLFSVSVDQMLDVRTCPTCDDKPPRGLTCNSCGLGDGVNP